MSAMTIENGNADIIRMLLSACRPPAKGRIAAMRASSTPQTTLVLRCGVRLPFSESDVKTNVALSADVMKNEKTNTTAIIESTVPAG